MASFDAWRTYEGWLSCGSTVILWIAITKTLGSVAVWMNGEGSRSLLVTSISYFIATLTIVRWRVLGLLDLARIDKTKEERRIVKEG